MKRPCNSKLPTERCIPGAANTHGTPMNIYEENSARNFRVQSDREWTLVLCTSLIHRESLGIPSNCPGTSGTVG